MVRVTEIANVLPGQISLLWVKGWVLSEQIKMEPGQDGFPLIISGMIRQFFFLRQGLMEPRVRRISDFWFSCLYLLSAMLQMCATTVYVAQETESRISCMLGKHSADWTTIPRPWSWLWILAVLIGIDSVWFYFILLLSLKKFQTRYLSEDTSIFQVQRL